MNSTNLRPGVSRSNIAGTCFNFCASLSPVMLMASFSTGDLAFKFSIILNTADGLSGAVFSTSATTIICSCSNTSFSGNGFLMAAKTKLLNPRRISIVVGKTNRESRRSMGLNLRVKPVNWLIITDDFDCREFSGYVRRNWRSSSWRLNNSDVGRPCGQWVESSAI